MTFSEVVVMEKVCMLCLGSFSFLAVSLMFAIFRVICTEEYTNAFTASRDTNISPKVMFYAIHMCE